MSEHPLTSALMLAMTHSNEPMVLTDPQLADHPLIAVNAAFVELSLYPASEIVGRNCRFLQGDGTEPLARARIRKCLAEQRGCTEWMLNYRSDGSKFWNLLFISPIFAEDGTLLHYFGNQRDITEGPPASLPDYTLGKADMPHAGQLRFEALMTELVEMQRTPDETAHALERLVAAARELNEITTPLAPAPWVLPPP